jgi:DNA-binding IclR family transcriptional regulator
MNPTPDDSLAVNTQASQARKHAGPVQVVDKVVLLLEELAKEEEATVARITELINEPRSTVYRLCASLEAHDLIEPGVRKGTFRLGLGLLRFSGVILTRFDIRAAAQPVMEAIHRERGETICLCIRRENEAVCVERIEGLWVRTMSLTLGSSLPLHLGAVSRVILAHESEDFIETYLEHEFARVVPQDRMSAVELRSELAEIRDAGFAVNDGELVPGMAAVAAPIFNHAGKLYGALTMSGPRPAILEDSEESSIALIVDAARQVSRSLGYVDAAAASRSSDAPLVR